MSGDDDIPWTLNGVSEEARAAARKAAEQAGQSLGDWLSDAIRNTDLEERWTSRGLGAASDSPDRAALATTMALLERRMTDMERRLDDALGELRARLEALDGGDKSR